MKCPICDEEVVLERNLEKHQKGKVCRALAFEQRRIKENWRWFDRRRKLESRLKEAGLDYVDGPRVYIGGFQQRVIHVREALWVPGPVADVLDCYVGIRTFTGCVRTVKTLTELERRLAWLYKTSPTCRGERRREKPS